MHISELDSLRNNPMIRFKNEEVDGEQYTIVHYMIANSELWTNPVALEARGNVYNSNGDCVCACFPKFFNLNERPENQENLIKDNIVLFEEKKDGSLVTPILTPKGNIVFKTKKSFYSDVALLANQCVTEDILKLSRIYLEELLTPLFEFTHPETQIVINYGPKPQFTLLAVRDMINGQEIPYEYLKEDLAQLNSSIPLINTYSFSTWDQFRNTLETTKGIEGFVLILDDGRRVKVKTEEYLRLHRVYTELRQRDVAEACVDETLDDILGVLVQSGFNLSPIREIEHQVIQEISSVERQVLDIIKTCSDLTPKDIALQYKDHPLFGLIMAEFRGKTPNYIEYWKKTYLKNYSLRSVYSESF